MSGKFSKKAKKSPSRKRKSGSGLWIGLCAFLVLLGLSVVLLLALTSDEDTSQPQETTPTTVQTEMENPAAETTEPAVQIDEIIESDMNMENGLEIINIGKYTGLYMEDGSDEIVSDVMMIVVRNNGEQDVQLGRITAVCGGEEYRFTLTNLAAGAQVVLLDQDRKASPGAQLTSAVLETSTFFEEPMDVMADVIRISGLNGMLNVQNISDADIDGDIYIYYKYAARDIYYGGITFRVRVEGGLKAGELRQIPAGHYSPDGCAIVQVMTHE